MAWIIDPAHTRIDFSVKHMMIATVRGNFAKFNGTVNVNDADLSLSTVEGVIETASLSTGEPNRDTHLRSPDFFDAEHYPTMAFKSTRITHVSGDRWQVAGGLTIKDVTREIVFDVTSEGRGKSPWGTEVWGLSAQTSLNRKDYGLTWNVGLETGGFLVGDTVKIDVELELVSKPAAAAPETEPKSSTAAA